MIQIKIIMTRNDLNRDL